MLEYIQKPLNSVELWVEPNRFILTPTNLEENSTSLCIPFDYEANIHELSNLLLFNKLLLQNLFTSQFL
jgi:hypothetical protein